VYFTYSHSTHQVRMVLNAMLGHTPAETPTIHTLLLSAIVICILTISAKKRKHAHARSAR
jgi:hypothetical protein